MEIVMIKLEAYKNTDWYLQESKKLFFNKNANPGTVKNKFKERTAIIETALEDIGLEEVIVKDETETFLEKIITADYSELLRIKEKVDEGGGASLFRNSEGAFLKEWKLMYMSYDRLIYRKINIKLINTSGIKVCPYCNENYINSRDIRASAQLDHFFPRSKYPIFAISLYNLIPSCYACNHNKSDNEVGISPYDPEVEYDKIKIGWIPLGDKYLTEENQIEITLDYMGGDKEIEKKFVQGLEKMGIKSAYSFHRDYMQELIKKRVIYNKYRLKELYDNYTLLFADENELIRILYGNYHTEKELIKRPLSKMTMDFLNE